jgi:hypothetical protein
VGFLETVEQAKAFLGRNRRVSLRALARDFELGDEALDELVDELVDVQQVADQTLDLARREGSDTGLRLAHLAQLMVRRFRGRCWRSWAHGCLASRVRTARGRPALRSLHRAGGARPRAPREPQN